MSSSHRRIADGACVGLAQLATGEFVASLLAEASSPIDNVGQIVIDLTPGPAVDAVVATAESADKLALRASLVAGWIGATAAAQRRDDRLNASVLAALGLATAAALGARSTGRRTTSVAAATAGATAAAASRAVLRSRGGSRLRAVIVAVSGAALVGTVKRRRANDARLDDERDAICLPHPANAVKALPPDAGFVVPGLSPLLTPPERFYVTDVQFSAPRVRRSTWRLRVTGMVDAPYELSLDELLAHDLVEIHATLVCVHNPVGGPRIGSARWLGVPVDDLLRRAEPYADADQLVARSVDGFTAGVPIERIAPPHQAIVAIAMNGQPLPIANGFPARLLVPGLWGADANTKWLTEVEATTWAAVSDYWDRRGWPRQPSIVRPGSRIDVPSHRAVLQAGPVTLAGVAWAPDSGVQRVEVAVDDGPWTPADLSAEVAPALWRQWRLSWAATPGDHIVRVRTQATDGAQHQHVEPPYPVGSSGLHTIRVQILSRRPAALEHARAHAAATVDDVHRRTRLASTGVWAWTSRGYPPARKWPAPAARDFGQVRRRA